jgi:sugar phosphate isomerase/epimerase
MSKRPVAVQLWTLRDEIAADLAGTLARAGEIGYAGVELWFPEYPPVGQLRAILDDTDLQPVGAHVPFLDLRDDFSRIADYHHALGNGDLVVPVIPGDLRRGEADWKERVVEIEAIARRCQEAGFRFSYHNHGMELEETVDGTAVHDYIFSSVPADLLKAELDTYFFAAAGLDPAAAIRRYVGRVPLLHLKDRALPPAHGTVEIGRGTIDWDGVLAAAAEADVEWFIVEQNCQEHPPLESLRMSLEFLRAHGTA